MVLTLHARCRWLLLTSSPAMTGTISADISGVNLASAEVRGT